MDLRGRVRLISMFFQLLHDQLLLLPVELNGQAGENHGGNEDGNQKNRYPPPLWSGSHESVYYFDVARRPEPGK